MNYIQLAWIRRGKKLSHIGSCIEELTGWTADEVREKPLNELIAPDTLGFMKSEYYTGPPGGIIPRAFPMALLHREGHKVVCRAVVVCRYDDNGNLAEAWGCLQCGQYQAAQNDLLTWWVNAPAQALAMFSRVAGAYA
jgi:hypothetical protein